MGTMQDFTADSTVIAARELEETLLMLPESRWDWRASPDSRSALNMVAECAIMNRETMGMIQTGRFPSESVTSAYRDEIADLAADWARLQTLLHANAAQVADVIRAVPDSELADVFVLPWETITKGRVMLYPYWNMTYHTGQIYFIQSLAGAAD